VLMRRTLLFVLLLVFSVHASITCQVTTTYTHLSDTIIHLPRGDSIELQGSGPAIVPNEPAGLLITYRPFYSLSDTIAVSRVALELFQELIPHFTGRPLFVVMRAVNVPAARRNQGGYYPLSAYGVVLERHSDNRWYLLNESQPAF
jgi:hypothetical protein